MPGVRRPTGVPVIAAVATGAKEHGELPKLRDRLARPGERHRDGRN
jgi:hypothetical protein